MFSPAPNWQSFLDPALTEGLDEEVMDGETDGLELILAELERERQEEQLLREAEKAFHIIKKLTSMIHVGGKHLRASKALEATGMAAH